MAEPGEAAADADVEAGEAVAADAQPPAPAPASDSFAGHAPRPTPARTGTPLIEARGLGRRFGDVTALADVSLAIRPGERHALIGENGAGKSTLVKILYGVLEPGAGEVLWEGEPVRVSSPAQARALGIGMVFQHFSVFEALTVAENIALSVPDLDLGGIAERIEALAETYGLALDPRRPVHTLSAGEKQRVEILRCLLQEPRLLVLDEPTSVLTPQEAEVLFAALERLSEEGCAILYISHKLGEVRALCESATVLRRGAVVARLDPRERAPADIAALMIGARVPAVKREHDATEPVEKLRLRVAGLAMPAEPPHGMALRNINFVVRAGEIFGIAGVAGEGQSELMAALSGERRSPVAGSVQIGRHRIGRAGPSARRRVGAAFVPEERLGHAAVPEMDLADNVILAHHAVLPLAPGGLLSRGRARAWVERVRAAFDVRGGGQGAVPKAGALSGGNLQKFVVGREILRKPKILVVNQPTWGVDAGAAAVIRQALVDLAGEGAGIVVISQDLDELFEIADRMAVMQNGRLSYARPTEEFTPESIGLLMAQGALDPEDVPRKRRKRRGSGSGSGSLGGGDRAARGRFSIAGLFSGTRGYGRAW